MARGALEWRLLGDCVAPLQAAFPPSGCLFLLDVMGRHGRVDLVLGLSQVASRVAQYLVPGERRLRQSLPVESGFDALADVVVHQLTDLIRSVVSIVNVCPAVAVDDQLERGGQTHPDAGVPEGKYRTQAVLDEVHAGSVVSKESVVMTESMELSEQGRRGFLLCCQCASPSGVAHRDERAYEGDSGPDEAANDCIQHVGSLAADLGVCKPDAE